MRRFGLVLLGLLGLLSIHAQVAAGQRVKLKAGYTWANLAWGFDDGGRDSTDGMKVVLVDPDFTSKSRIANYIANGHIVMCYISAGTVEYWRDDYKEFKARWDALALERMENWADEAWLDIRQADKVLELMRIRMERAKSKGCQAIEPDNLDCYLDDACYGPMGLKESTAKPISKDYVIRLAALAHSLDLSIVLKNAVELAPYVFTHFDGAISEGCKRWNECGDFKRYFHRTGKAFFAVEYNGDSSKCDTSEMMMKYCDAQSGGYLCKNSVNEFRDCFEPLSGSLPVTEYIGGPPVTSPPTSPKPTGIPTKNPSKMPTPSPIPVPTPAPVEVPNRVMLPHGTTWANLAWGFPEGGKDNVQGMKLVIVDTNDMSKERIQELKQDGHIVMCYFSVGTAETWRSDYQENQAAWDALALGTSSEWSDELWLDIRRMNDLLPLISDRFEKAKELGCQAIEPDGLDCYANADCYQKMGLSSGQPLVETAVEFALSVADIAHSLGMAIVSKNAVELVPEIHQEFDGATVEDCFRYAECSIYLDYYWKAGKAVFAVEYSNFKCKNAGNVMLKTCRGTKGGGICGKKSKQMNECFAPNSVLPATQWLYDTPGDDGPSGSELNTKPAGYRVRLKPGMTWANLAWGYKDGGRDSTDGMQVVFVDPDYTTPATVANLKSKKHIVMCYISVGTAETFRDDYKENPAAWDQYTLGTLSNWKDEAWLDIRQMDEILALLGPRFQRAADLGCDGIEPDNIDCYLDRDCWGRMNGVSSGDEIIPIEVEFTRRLAEMAHGLEMSIVSKNAVEILPQIHTFFDGAVAEGCFRWNECDPYKQYYWDMNKAFFAMEYSRDKKLCKKASNMMLKYCKPKKGGYECDEKSPVKECFAPDRDFPDVEYYNGTIIENDSSNDGPSSPSPYPTRAKIPPGTFANLAWGFDDGGSDSIQGMKTVIIDPDYVSASEVSRMIQNKHIVMCYVSVGTIEGFRDDYKQNKAEWDALALGRMTSWDEQWIDIRKMEKVLSLMEDRFQRAKALGCQAIEPDNMDCYQNDDCFKRMRPKAKAKDIKATQITYVKRLADMAHRMGMGMVMKNSVDLVNAIKDVVDGAVTEGCEYWNECDVYTKAFVNNGKGHFNHEYNDNVGKNCADPKVMTKYCKGNKGGYLCTSAQSQWRECFQPDKTLADTEYIG